MRQSFLLKQYWIIKCTCGQTSIVLANHDISIGKSFYYSISKCLLTQDDWNLFFCVSCLTLYSRDSGVKSEILKNKLHSEVHNLQTIQKFFQDDCKVKVKCTLVQALRLCTGHTAHRGSRGIALPFLDHGTRRGWGVSVTPWPLFSPGKDPLHIVQEAGWAPGPVWTGVENLAPHRDSIPRTSSP